MGATVRACLFKIGEDFILLHMLFQQPFDLFVFEIIGIPRGSLGTTLKPLKGLSHLLQTQSDFCQVDA